jgi:hypothetical protein
MLIVKKYALTGRAVATNIIKKFKEAPFIKAFLSK